jgi:hypothetical protein
MDFPTPVFRKLEAQVFRLLECAMVGQAKTGNTAKKLTGLDGICPTTSRKLSVSEMQNQSLKRAWD